MLGIEDDSKLLAHVACFAEFVNGAIGHNNMHSISAPTIQQGIKFTKAKA